MTKHTAFPAFLIALGLALSGFFIAHALSNIKSFDRYVSVKGLSQREVKSNEAIWQIQFTYSSDSLDDLYQGIADAQNKVKEFLLQQGFRADDLQIQPVSVTDNQSNSYNTNTAAKRYIATGGIVLTSSNVDQVRLSIQSTGTLVKEGVVVTQSNVRYMYTELNTIKPTMLDEATANAKVAAESFAKNSHSHIGQIRDANQGLFSITDTTGSYSDGSSIYKNVRVVTTVEYFLR